VRTGHPLSRSGSHRLRDGTEGDDPRRGGVERGHASGVGLDLPKLLRRNRAKPGTRSPSPAQEVPGASASLLRGRDDDFAGELEGNAMLFAKRTIEAHPRTATAPSASRACSRCPSEGLRCCAPSGEARLRPPSPGPGPRHPAPAQELKGGREPTIPPPDDDVVHGGGYGS
jgi:hypothetical protein